MFDFLKKKKLEDKKPSSVKSLESKGKKIEKKEKVKKVVEKQKVEKPAEVKVPKIKDKRPGFGWKFLHSPHITEKATNLASKNKYVFKVKDDATKNEIRKSIEDVYGVNVVNIKVINISSKKRRLGRTTGVKKGYKKAIIQLKEGQKIEVLPI